VSRYRERLLADSVVDAEWLSRVNEDVAMTRRRLLEAFGR
jgi:hypothetical protein